MREAKPHAPVQADEMPSSADAITHAIGRTAGDTASAALPYHDQIQAAFGKHDVSGLRAAVGGGAGAAAEAIGADAYALGKSVVFRDAPSLHTAAHEAAHYIQGRRGSAGLADEHHADAVADAVVAGKSAEGLLSAGGAPGGGGDVVQRTAIAGRDTRNPADVLAIQQYLMNPARTYQELQLIREALLRDKHDGWEQWIVFVDGQIERWQVDDVRSKQDRHNWGTGSVYVDNKLAYLMEQPVHSGRMTTEFSAPPMMMQTPEIDVSHMDSEVEVLRNIKHVLGGVLTRSPPSEVIIKLVSTNGACNGCKGRLSALAEEVINYLRSISWSYNFRLTFQYRYIRPPKDTVRHHGGRGRPGSTAVPTTYGHHGDMETSLIDGSSTYQHDDTFEFDPVEEGTLVEMEQHSADYQVDQLANLFQAFNLNGGQ